MCLWSCEYSRACGSRPGSSAVVGSFKCPFLGCLRKWNLVLTKFASDTRGGTVQMFSVRTESRASGSSAESVSRFLCTHKDYVGRVGEKTQIKIKLHLTK